ncbi:hypothetical protein [Algoriphagus namhaensis]
MINDQVGESKVQSQFLMVNDQVGEGWNFQAQFTMFNDQRFGMLDN